MRKVKAGQIRQICKWIVLRGGQTRKAVRNAGIVILRGRGRGRLASASVSSLEYGLCSRSPCFLCASFAVHGKRGHVEQTGEAAGFPEATTGNF